MGATVTDRTRGDGPAADPLDVLVVGAGFAGLYALHRLHRDGFRVAGIEAGGDVGGTWYWNRYPGARCDVESLDYSYSFSPELEQEWDWTERYATQPEILRYLQHVADRFDLRRHIRFGTRVEAAHLDEGDLRWRVTTSAGDTLTTRSLILATGPLSAANLPSLPGLDRFAGRVLHTGQWPHEPVDFTGRNVAVIGTGSSGIQLVPVVAAEAAQLFVLQRTPNFTIPAQNWAWDPDALRQAKAGYAERRAVAKANAAGTPGAPPLHATFDVDDDERQRLFEQRWQVGGARFTRSFTDTMADHAANDQAATFVRGKIAELVADPAVAARLMPRGYPLGAKRICVDTGYYATFNRDNVALVDLNAEPIRSVEADGIGVGDRLLAVDDLIFATGFDAMTGAISRMAVTGRAGATLAGSWAAGPRSYLGVAVAGFPNLYLVNGPGSPSVLSNMVLTSEQQVDWIADALGYAREHHLVALEASETAEKEWDAHCASISEGSLMYEADSWYVGANIPGKPRVLLPYLGGLARYREQCDLIAADDYRGFHAYRS